MNFWAFPRYSWPRVATKGERSGQAYGHALASIKSANGLASFTSDKAYSATIPEIGPMRPHPKKAV